MYKNSNTIVVLAKQNSYSCNEIKQKIYFFLQELSIDLSIFKNKKILIKPNLLSPSEPDKNVTTNPIFVKAVADIFLEHSACVSIGDSPAFGNTLKCLKASGIYDQFKKNNVNFVEFKNPIEINNNGLFKKFIITKDILDCDFIINLPKIKSHTQMHLTAAVKNMFGIVPGGLKARAHFEIGHDHLKFAHMLLELCYYKKPIISIADGISAMDGNGPGSGDTYQLNTIAASKDPVALDRVIAEIISFDPEKILIFKASKISKKGEYDLDKIEIKGEKIKNLKVNNFRPSQKEASLTFLPYFLIRPLKKILSYRPHVNRSKCINCGQCIDICPANAIKKRKRHVKINNKKCIHCFCCQEICPQGAIIPKRNFLGNLVSFFIFSNK